MKKFSKISNTKVNKKPELKNENGSNIPLRYSIHRLIRELLSIRIYGSIDPILEGNLSIQGEDEFISAIIDLFKEKDVQDQIKLLENAKYLGVDKMLENLNNYSLNIDPNEIKSHRLRIKELFDGDDVIKEAINQSSKVKDPKKALNRHLVAERMVETEDLSKELLKEISKIYLKKYNELK